MLRPYAPTSALGQGWVSDLLALLLNNADCQKLHTMLRARYSRLPYNSCVQSRETRVCTPTLPPLTWLTAV